MDGRSNLLPEKQELNQPRENGSFFNYDPLEVQKIPRYSNESLVQETRDMVKNRQLPGVEIGNFTAKAFREAVQNINKTDSGKGDSNNLGREGDPGFYRMPGVKPNGNENDLNKHPDQPKNSISSHRNPDGGYSHRNPDIAPAPKTGSEDWINKHPGQKPDPWRPTDDGNRTQGQPPMESPDQNSNKADGQKPPTDKDPINEHHNENKPANPERPNPGLTCEDLENAEGKLPLSKLPPRRCPEFYSENPVKPR